MYCIVFTVLMDSHQILLNCLSIVEPVLAWQDQILPVVNLSAAGVLIFPAEVTILKII